MYKEVRSGKEILDDFFNTLKEIPDIDKSIADILIDLYQNDKLSQKNISNALLKRREEAVHDKN